jgi:peroxiredoxin
VKSLNRPIALAALGVAIAVGVYLALPQRVAAPDATFTTIEGQTLATADLRGKVVLVNFWAPDCIPCMREMPRIVQTYNKYRARGFETVAVAMSYDPPNRVLEYARKNALPFKIALDLSGELARRFGDVQFTPTTFVIDRRGNIVKRYLGEPDFAALHSLLESKLDEKT